MSTLKSRCPATGELIWEGRVAGADAVGAVVGLARGAFQSWSAMHPAARSQYVERYQEALSAQSDRLAAAIGRETGEPLWEAKQEVTSMISKVTISIHALAMRAGEVKCETAFGRSFLRHRPHGVMAIYGPYNFPGHLPNGHIVPVLLAGNTIVFKSSEGHCQANLPQ